VYCAPAGAGIAGRLLAFRRKNRYIVRGFYIGAAVVCAYPSGIRQGLKSDRPTPYHAHGVAQPVRMDVRRGFRDKPEVCIRCCQTMTQ